MKGKLSLSIVCILLAVSIISIGCGKAPTQYVTLPATTVTLPAVTVTGVTTIPAITTTLPPYTVTVTPLTIGPNPFLPDDPTPIRTHALIIKQLEGTCLVCHGQGGPYEFPISPEHGGPPFWDGTKSGSTLNPGLYIVVQDSIQDHADRQANICLSCHTVPGT